MAKTSTPRKSSKAVSKKSEDGYGTTTRRRDGSYVQSQTTRYGGVTLVQQKYGLSKKTKANFPEEKAANDRFKAEATNAIALVNDAIKICRERGDSDAVHDLYDARAALEKALHAKKPENRKHWYEYAKKVVLHAKTRSRAIANKRFFGNASGNRI